MYIVGKWDSMRANEIISEIQLLPVSSQIYIVEKTIHLIRQQEEENDMLMAAEALCEDYKTDKELSAFSAIDFENFYEAICK